MLHTRKIVFFAVLVSLFTLSFNVLASNTSTLFRNSGDPVVGNPKGKVTVVEFFDYRCSHCVNMVPVLSDVIKSNPNLRVVYKDYPIRGPESLFAARAALAANKQGKYREFSHALLSAGSLSDDSVFEIAKSVGLDVNRLKRDMNSSSVNNTLKTNMNLAREMNVNGTPAFFIGRTDSKDSKNVDMVLGEMSQTELQEAINNASK